MRHWPSAPNSRHLAPYLGAEHPEPVSRTGVSGAVRGLWAGKPPSGADGTRGRSDPRDPGGDPYQERLKPTKKALVSSTIQPSKIVNTVRGPRTSGLLRVVTRAGWMRSVVLWVDIGRFPF